MTINTIQELLCAYHEAMNEFFLLHQEAVLASDFPLSIKLLNRFSALLRQHINTENTVFFTLHAKKLEAEQYRWPASLYQHEHNKIEQLLSKIEKSAACLTKDVNRRQIIALLEEELRFKNVIEHHEQREEIALLPELQETLEPSELTALIDKITSEWPPITQLVAECDELKGLIS